MGLQHTLYTSFTRYSRFKPHEFLAAACSECPLVGTRRLGPGVMRASAFWDEEQLYQALTLHGTGQKQVHAQRWSRRGLPGKWMNHFWFNPTRLDLG